MELRDAPLALQFRFFLRKEKKKTRPFNVHAEDNYSLERARRLFCQIPSLPPSAGPPVAVSGVMPEKRACRELSCADENARFACEASIVGEKSTDSESATRDLTARD